MSQFLLAPAAKSDILEIWTYYAAEVGDAALADRMRDEIFAGIRAAARKPDIGHFRRNFDFSVCGGLVRILAAGSPRRQNRSH